MDVHRLGSYPLGLQPLGSQPPGTHRPDLHRMDLRDTRMRQKARREQQADVDDALRRWHGVDFLLLARELGVGPKRLRARAESIGALPKPI